MLKKDFDQIVKKFEKFNLDNDFEIEIDSPNYKEKEINIFFPREDDNIVFKTQEFVKYIDEIDTIVYDKKKVCTKTIRQFPIIFNVNIDNLLDEFSFSFRNEKYIIRIIKTPFLIGLGSLHFGFYNKYFPPCSYYHAIEIIYSDELNVLEEKTEENIIKSFIYEFYLASGAHIELFELYDFDEYFGPNNEINNKDIEIDKLPDYNDSIELFLNAVSTSNEEISFLYFYKIIEYFSPTASKIKSFDILSKKFDELKYKEVTNDDLSSVFEIADAFRKSKSDSELCYHVMSISIDIIELFKHLPSRIQDKIAKEESINKKNINYKLTPEKLDAIFTKLGKILYSTRNKIVHAKSNYESNGLECNPEDLKQMNIFLNEATKQIIKWNDRLPNHSKRN